MRHYDSGMRTVEVALEHRIAQWAERRGVMLTMVRDGDDIVIDFERAESATWFALEFSRAD